MSSPPPTKPPRGVKQGKETSGLLMSVIRTLSASETNEQREKERAKLEKEYKKSDARLDELVAAHAQEIMEVMEKFNAVNLALSSWSSHCDAAVARLAACRSLLRLRRDDLRRLWTEARTAAHALNMLTDIPEFCYVRKAHFPLLDSERVVVSEREARESLAAGRVLACAHTLRSALATLAESLAQVTALSATRQQLEAKKSEVVEVIVRRLSDAVYRSERAPLTRRLSSRRRVAHLLAELTKPSEVTDAYMQDITPEFEASLTEEDSTFETTVMISLEALGVLEQLKEATEKYKCQIQNELLEVIDSVSRRIIEEGDIDPEPEIEEDGALGESEIVADSGRPLARLIACLADEFRDCASRNKRLIQLWRATLQKYKLSESSLHTEQHYWSAVQQVLQLLLTEYLEIESVTLMVARGATAPAAPTTKLQAYFAKKRPPRTREKLFKLTAPPGSSPAATARRHRYPLVCRPDPAHLHAVLPTLHALCADIETLTGGGECSLRAFISDYVRTGESERLAAAARTDIDAAMRSNTAWRERTRAPQPHGKPTSVNGSARVIFECVWAGWGAVSRTAVAARSCGACGGAAALRPLQAALAALATHCRAAQTRLATAGGCRAARWLADDDIVRFLQSLPNWKAALQDVPDSKQQAQELTQSYEREAEILGSSLGDGAVSRKEIISDINALDDLAVLCESMEWLSENIKRIPSLVSGGSGSAGGIKPGEKFLGDIAAAAMIFDEIAHKCLLLLHLEMRIECFHYLCGEAAAAADGAAAADDAAGGAALLASALLAFHERATAVMAPRRLRYILNGVGEMMSAAVVWRWQESSRGASDAAARLAALRHCLAALQLPHSGLHRAHAYLQLLNQTPEEIIAQIREKGAQFSELEYLNAFKIIGARRGVSQSDMRAHLKSLSTALGHVGVTV